jgi:hypothetical protein
MVFFHIQILKKRILVKKFRIKYQFSYLNNNFHIQIKCFTIGMTIFRLNNDFLYILKIKMKIKNFKFTLKNLILKFQSSNINF